MTTIGIFFGSDTGSTRKIAKQIADHFGALAAKPVNINKASAADLAAFDYLILGTPTLGEGQLPGMGANCGGESWEEFMPQFDGLDLAGKKVALFGLGDQAGYPGQFVNALGELFDAVEGCGGEVVAPWPVAGYSFSASTALLDDGHFVGLVLDQDNQRELSDSRLHSWLTSVAAAFALSPVAA